MELFLGIVVGVELMCKRDGVSAHLDSWSVGQLLGTALRILFGCQSPGYTGTSRKEAADALVGTGVLMSGILGIFKIFSKR